MEESAEVRARLERIGALTRAGAPRPELLAAIRGLIAEGTKGGTDPDDGARARAAQAGDSPTGREAAPADGAARSAFVREGGVAVS